MSLRGENVRKDKKGEYYLSPHPLTAPSPSEDMEKGERREFILDFHWLFVVSLDNENKLEFRIEGNEYEDSFAKEELVYIKTASYSSVKNYIENLINELENGTDICLRNISPCCEDSPCNDCKEWKHECTYMNITDKICGHCPHHEN